MKTQTFEIKVALLGYVSAGKTTVLNALLQGKFSEVSMRRTTAGVNFFRVYAPTKSSTLEPDNLRTAEHTLHEITNDNARLRQAKEIQESTFDIAIDEPLCEMHKDTKLVLVDIPGLNEAGSKDMYRDYVNSKWDTFDCVIVVMDVVQGVNTEEQVQLLELVKKNLMNNKNLPVIVLCNKVDDPESIDKRYCKGYRVSKIKNK